MTPRVIRTISAHADVDRLFAKGRRASQPALLVLAAHTSQSRDQDGRVIFVAGKRLGGAVLRNRSKRVLREMVRRAGGPWPGWDVALVARSGTAQTSPDALDRSLSAALRALEIRP